MKTIYISGAMTGVKEMNFPEFNRVANILRAEGYSVLNPADHGCLPDYSWSDYMRKDIIDLMNSNCVATLDGWENSRGASLEVYIAKNLGMDVMNYRDYIRGDMNE